MQKKGVLVTVKNVLTGMLQEPKNRVYSSAHRASWTREVYDIPKNKLRGGPPYTGSSLPMNPYRGRIVHHERYLPSSSFNDFDAKKETGVRGGSGDKRAPNSISTDQKRDTCPPPGIRNRGVFLISFLLHQLDLHSR